MCNRDLGSLTFDLRPAIDPKLSILGSLADLRRNVQRGTLNELKRPGPPVEASFYASPWHVGSELPRLLAVLLDLARR